MGKDSEIQDIQKCGMAFTPGAATETRTLQPRKGHDMKGLKCSRSTKHPGRMGREWLSAVPCAFDVPPGCSDTREWLGQNWQKETIFHGDRVKYPHWTKNNWVNSQTSTTASKYQNNSSEPGAANFQRLGGYSGKTDITCSCTLACMSTWLWSETQYWVKLANNLTQYGHTDVYDDVYMP